MKMRAIASRGGIVRFAGLVLLIAGVAGTLSAVRSVRSDHLVPDTGALLAATVTVETVSTVRADHVGDFVWTTGSGSGVLISAERCEVWTNHHVIEDAAFVEVRVHSREVSRSFRARIVGSVSEPDVAVLKLERCDGIAQAKMGDSDRVRAGDVAYAVGNPFGANPNTLTRGIVSHTHRYMDSASAYLQTDATIGLGSSGGPLFNRAGEVIGLNVGVAVGHASLNSGFGYAIPINEVSDAAMRISSGTTARSDAGLTGLANELDAESAGMLGVPDGHGAIAIARTPTEGPAAGRLFARDAVFRLGGKLVQSVRHFERMLGAHEPGDTLSVTLMRDGKKIDTHLKMADSKAVDVVRAAEPYEGLLGLGLAYWGDEPGVLGQYKHPVITRIYNYGPAHSARISASRKSARARGPARAHVLLSIEMVTGVILQGEYLPVPDARTLDAIAARAHELGASMLLEVTSHRPRNPRIPGRDMRLFNSTLHRIVPARSSAGVARQEIDTTNSKRTNDSAGDA